MQTIHNSVSEDRYMQLLQLREKLSAFQTVSCRLMHEQMSLVEESIPGDADPEQLKLKRKGLCDPTIRRNLLGCAHTSANITFARLADSAYDMGALQLTSRPSELINAMVVKIYLMDHAKSDLEKEKAFAQLQQQPIMARIYDELREIATVHESTIDKLEQLRHQIMHQLKTAIDCYYDVVDH